MYLEVALNDRPSILSAAEIEALTEELRGEAEGFIELLLSPGFSADEVRKNLERLIEPSAIKPYRIEEFLRQRKITLEHRELLLASSLDEVYVYPDGKRGFIRRSVALRAIDGGSIIVSPKAFWIRRDGRWYKTVESNEFTVSDSLDAFIRNQEDNPAGGQPGE